MPRHEAEYLQQIRLFFEDVSRLSVVAGRAAYLPLTRRIERGRMFRRVLADSPEKTFQRLQQVTARSFAQFNAVHQLPFLPPLTPTELGPQIETFLDNPKMTAPTALNTRFYAADLSREDKEKWVELGWRCFYLLALLPPNLRTNIATATITAEAVQHFRVVHQQEKEAKQRLIEGTLRYIVRLACGYINRGLPYLDLVQIGYFGLLNAAEKFSEPLGAHFQMYAAIWIRQRITRALAEQAKLLYAPVHLIDEFAILDQADRCFAENPLITHTERRTHIQRAFDARPAKQTRKAASLAVIVRAHRPHFSLERAGIAPFIVADMDMDQHAEKFDMLQRFDGILEKLNVREREIIELRFGLYDGEPRTLEQVGQRFGVTRERVRQLEGAAMRKIQKPTRTRTIHEYVVDDMIADRMTPAVNAYASTLLHRHDAIDEDGLHAAYRRVEDQAAIEALILDYFPDLRRHNTAGAVRPSQT